jgi:hypothetical protein
LYLKGNGLKLDYKEGRVKKEGVCFDSQYLVKVSQKKEKTGINAVKLKGSTYLTSMTN